MSKHTPTPRLTDKEISEIHHALDLAESDYDQGTPVSKIGLKRISEIRNKLHAIQIARHTKKLLRGDTNV